MFQVRKKVIEQINIDDPDIIEKVSDALDEIKKDATFQTLTTGGGKNSPGPYSDKIDFVANKLREALEP